MCLCVRFKGLLIGYIILCGHIATLSATKQTLHNVHTIKSLIMHTNMTEDLPTNADHSILLVLLSYHTGIVHALFTLNC